MYTLSVLDPFGFYAPIVSRREVKVTYKRPKKKVFPIWKGHILLCARYRKLYPTTRGTIKRSLARAA